MKEMSLRYWTTWPAAMLRSETMLEKTSRDEQKIDDIRNEYLTQQIERIGKSECIVDGHFLFRNADRF